MITKENLKKTFLDLIAINEVYPQEREVIRYVQNRLSRTGILCQQDAFGNIVAKIAGKGESVLLSTHVDIPEPAPNVQYTTEGDIIRSDGSGILGADPKSGLAVLIEFLCDLASPDQGSHVPIEAVLTRGEEPGLLGALNLDYSLVDSKIGLVLDEDGPVTQVVTQAPASVRIDATFFGKAAHPREPEKGINALQAACDALVAVPSGYSREGVIWNVGIFESGTARNSIPGRAVLKGELRSYDTALVVSEGKRIQETWKEIAERVGAKCEVEATLVFEGYELDRNGKLFEGLERIFKTLNLKPNYICTYGGSDANIFNSRGIVSVAIGSGYYNAHQYSEYIDLGDMLEIFEFLTRFVRAS